LIQPGEGVTRESLDRGLARLCQLIDDVLATETLDGASDGAVARDVALGPMMDEALAAAMDAARGRGIAFRTQYDPRLLLHVDRDLAIRALRTVVENAVRFADRGDVAVEVEDRGAEVAVHVSDSSPGVAGGVKLVVGRRPMEALGWSISAECSLSVRCHLCLTLPAARA
jgi:signal transduction histidine kinase